MAIAAQQSNENKVDSIIELWPGKSTRQWQDDKRGDETFGIAKSLAPLIRAPFPGMRRYGRRGPRFRSIEADFLKPAAKCQTSLCVLSDRDRRLKPNLSCTRRSDTPPRHQFDSPGRRCSIKWRSQVEYKWKSVERGSDPDVCMKPL